MNIGIHAPPPSPRDPLGLERPIARLLTWGTLASVISLTIGLGGMIVTGRSPVDPAWPPLDVGQIPADVLSLRPEGFIWLGLCLAVLTPVSRVVAALVGFLRSRERQMASIAALVLVVIALSVVAGARLGA